MKLACRACGASWGLTEGLLTCRCGAPLRKDLAANTCVEESEASSEASSWRRFRNQLGSWQAARSLGREGVWESTLNAIEAQSLRWSPQGLNPTRTQMDSALGRAIGLTEGTLFTKSESSVFLGSHKARHMVASALYLSTLPGARPPWAIFSCGNAAMGAAAVARALAHPLYTFVPGEIAPSAEEWLTHLGATVVRVHREGAVGDGDPCHNRYREALERFGWVPFSCYGLDNWAAVEGAELLGLEMLSQISQLAHQGAPAQLDALVVQVGGGGLAHGVANGVERALALGLLEKRPRLFLIQTSSCHPLALSWLRLAHALCGATETKLPQQFREGQATAKRWAPEMLPALTTLAESPQGQAFFLQVARERSKWFPPWGANVPHSIAEGILDDTTYDGLEIAQSMFRSGGMPWVVEESELEETVTLARAHGEVNLSATGSAGLAGLTSLLRAGILAPSHRVGVLFTGVESRPPAPRDRPGRVVDLRPGDPLTQISGQ